MNTNGHQGRKHRFVFVRLHWWLKICLRLDCRIFFANGDEFANKERRFTNRRTKLTADDADLADKIQQRKCDFFNPWNPRHPRLKIFEFSWRWCSQIVNLHQADSSAAILSSQQRGILTRCQCLIDGRLKLVCRPQSRRHNSRLLRWVIHPIVIRPDKRSTLVA